MAVVSKIFSKCSDLTSTIVFQYNDIFFTPGGSAFYNGECWVDTTVTSSLVPVADVTFDYYTDCVACNADNLIGVVLQKCSTPSIQMVITTKSQIAPGLESVLYLYGDCWTVIGTTDANSNVVDTFTTYQDCPTCLAFSQIDTQLQPTLFVNCCDPTDTITLYVNHTHFVYPYGDTIVYNNKCYTADLLGITGTIVGYYEYPQYVSSVYCKDVFPCSTPTPTPSVTPTHTPTPTVTPSVTPTHTVTPTPTKTTGLPPTPSYTTTTTTRPAEQNQCDVITLLPLGVSCNVTSPTSPSSADGSITLSITGGTAPYTGITWSNGVTGTTMLTNLKAGTYSATVVDYYGDFTASTTCSVIAPTVTPTSTPTLTPTPSSTPTPYTGLCVTFTYQNTVNYQYQFHYNTPINGKPSWTANTVTNPITTSGNNLNLYYDNTLGQWIIKGFTSNTWYPNSPTKSVPPLSNWTIHGSTPVTNVLVTSGTCPTYSPMVVSVNTNPASCASSTNGSICITVYNGSGSFVYSIDGGVTTGHTNCFYNLASGTYSVYVKDTVTSATTTQNVTVQNLNLNTNVSMKFTQTSNTTLQSTTTTKAVKESYSLNTSDIPNGTTVNLTFTLSEEFLNCAPGDGNNNDSYVIIYKNGTPITITQTSSTTTMSNRANCSPYTCEDTKTISGGTCSVTKSDTLTFDIYNRVSIAPISNKQGCPTQLTNTIGVNGSFTYNRTNCVTLLANGLNVQSLVNRSAYDPNAPQ